MQLKVTKPSATAVSVAALGVSADLAPILEAVLTEFRAQVKVAGFRPGRAPNHIVEREVGEQRVQAEVIEHTAQAAFNQALKEHELRPLEPPHIEVKKFVPYQNIELVMSFEVMPEFKMPDYKKAKKSKPAVTINDEDVSQVLEALRIRAAQRTEAKRPSKSGDEVVIDMGGTQNGQPVAGAGGKDYPVLIGSKRFVSGFEDNLIGLKAGDHKVFKVPFPKDYAERSLAGQSVEFTVDVKRVLNLRLPESDAKFAAQIGPFKNLDELKADISRQLQTEKTDTAQRQLTDEVVRELVDKTEVPIPEHVLERQFGALWQEFENELKSQGTTLESYLQTQKQSREDLEKTMRAQATSRVKTSLVLSAVARAENIKVGPEEIAERVQLLQGQVQDPKTRAHLEKPESQQDIADQLMIEKTVNKLVAYAVAN